MTITTKEQILHAAATVFAEVGFRQARTRDICEAAGVNIASIHYHFGDKEQLYRKAVGYALTLQSPDWYQVAPDAPFEEKVKAWIKALATSCVGPQPELLSQLLAMELSDPTEVLGDIMNLMIRPRMQVLEGILLERMGESIDPDTLRRICIGTVGQIMIYHHSRPIIERMFKELPLENGELEALIDHIALSVVAMVEKLEERSR